MLLDKNHQFIGEVPTHIDYQILQQLAQRQDDAGMWNQEDAYVLKVTGKEMDTLMAESIPTAMDLIKASGPANVVEQIAMVMGVGDPIQYTPYYMVAWVAGLCEGLEQARGIEMPDKGVATQEHFWDLDGLSVAYAAYSRSHMFVTNQEILSEIESDHVPVVLMSGCFIDGYVIGCGFDDVKNPHIEGRSVLL